MTVVAAAPQDSYPARGDRQAVGLRKDAGTFSVEISLSPAPTATDHLTLAVIRHGAQTLRHEDLAGIARVDADGAVVRQDTGTQTRMAFTLGG